MVGTKIGGLKSKKTNLKRHGKDFYRKIGVKGGENGKGPFYSGGFAEEGKGRARARIAGVKGGRISRRGKKK